MCVKIWKIEAKLKLKSYLAEVFTTVSQPANNMGSNYYLKFKKMGIIDCTLILILILIIAYTLNYVD